MMTPCLSIVLPTYRPHFRFAASLLESIDRHAVDPEMAAITIVVEQENERFAQDMKARFPKLRIDWRTTEQIMEDLSIAGTPSDFLKRAGKFSFQSIKKIGAILQSSTEWTLVLDSESLFLKEFSFQSLLAAYARQRYVFFTQVADRGPLWIGSLSETVTVNAASLVGGQPDSWYLEYYHWFYQRDVWKDLIALLKFDGGFERWMEADTPFDVFENVLYYQYVRTREDLDYSFLDSLRLLSEHIPDDIAHRAWQALEGPLQIVGLLEHVTSLFSLDEIPRLEPFFTAFDLPFVRIEPYTIDPRVIEAIARFPSVRALVSSHRSRVMNKRVAVCVSGEFRAPSANIRSLRDFTTGVASDLFVHTWNTPAVPTIKDALSPLAIAVEERPNFDELASRVTKPEPNSKENRDAGSLSMFHGIQASIRLIDARSDDYDLVVRMRPDTVYQQSLRDIILMIADDETFDNDTIYVPDRFHSQGINDQFAIGSVAAMSRYGDIMTYLSKNIEREYFNPEHVMARHLIAQGLRIKTIPMDYLLLRSNPTDIRRFASIIHDQDSTWWSSALHGPAQIRSATALFAEKAKAVEFMQSHEHFEDWGFLISADHLTPASSKIWNAAFVKVDVRHDYKNPQVTLLVDPSTHTSPTDLFVDVLEQRVELVTQPPSGSLFVQAGDRARDITLVRFEDDLSRPSARLTLQSHDLERVPPSAYRLRPESGQTPSYANEDGDVRRGRGMEFIDRFLLEQSSGGVGSWRRLRAAVALRRGRARRRRGDLTGARSLYARVLSLDPRRTREWVQYGHVLKELGQVDEATAAYATALTLAPDNRDARFFYDAMRAR